MLVFMRAYCKSNLVLVSLYHWIAFLSCSMAAVIDEIKKFPPAIWKIAADRQNVEVMREV